jgi:hypothetical protein
MRQLQRQLHYIRYIEERNLKEEDIELFFDDHGNLSHRLKTDASLETQVLEETTLADVSLEEKVEVEVTKNKTVDELTPGATAVTIPKFLEETVTIEKKEEAISSESSSKPKSKRTPPPPKKKKATT